MLTGLAYAMGPTPQAGQGQGGGLMGFLPLIIIFVIFYFLLIRPQQKRAKEQKAMLESLKKGDKVIVSGGEYGVIEEVKANTVIVKIAENVKVKYGKAYVVALRQTEED
ncbi:MAG: preprotein translocase subunit YajC [Nitrospirota bacterium]|nr:preprotein translocase subunit YajC [Nitrospirota bacterium]